jgi:hypothetical protein
VILPALRPMNLSELAARVAAHGAVSGGVSALVTADDSSAVANNLGDELAFIADRPAQTIAVDPAVEPTIATITAAGDAIAVLHEFSRLDGSAWTGLDELRNRLHRDAALVLVLSPRDLVALQEHAPNLSSWLGGRVWRLDESEAVLSTEDVEKRLQILRAAFAKTDAEVIDAARDGRLPAEPEFAEWLVLLSHGDLLR